MNECWPGRRTSFMRSGMCVELWPGQGEGERHGHAIGKSACFDVEAMVEIDGVKAGPTRSHIALRNLRVERSKSRTPTASADSSFSSAAGVDLELALVFEKPGRYTLPILEITRIRCKYLREGKASIEGRESLFLLTAASQSELERLLEVIRDVKTGKTLADSRLCAACKEKGERQKVKQKREQQQPTDFEPNSRLDGDCQATKKQKVKVLECIFRKKQLSSLVDTGEEQVQHHLKDLLRRRDRDHASHKLNKMGMSPPEGSDARPIEIEEEVYYNASAKNGETSPEGTKSNYRGHNSPVQSETREAHVVKPTSPGKRVIFIDEIHRKNSADGLRRREAPRTVSERRSDTERVVRLRSSDEKENFDVCVDEFVRKIGEETVKRLVEERKGLDEVPRKVLEDEKRRVEEQRIFEVEERRREEEKEMMVRRKESIRKLIDQDRKLKDAWEAKLEEDRRWLEEEDDRKQKNEEGRLKKSLERRLQAEVRRRKEEKRKEEEKREEEEKRKAEEKRKDEDKRKVEEKKEDERRRKFLDRRLQEEDMLRKEEEDRRVQELKQMEEEEKRVKEAERKLQEQVQEALRKKQDEEEKVQEALKFFKLEEDRQELRAKEGLRKFQEAVKNANRHAQRYRSRVVEEARMAPEEVRKILEEQRDKLDHRKLDDDLRRWRNDETYRRAKEDRWTTPDQERSVFEEQRKRVEEVMKMSKRLYRKLGKNVKDGEETKQVAEGTVEEEVRSYTPTEGRRAPVGDDVPNGGFHERAFLDEFLSFHSNRKVRIDDKERPAKEAERFNLKEAIAKAERARQDELRKEELQRKKDAKAANGQKKKLAQERLKAARLEAKNLEKLLKEAQKRAKAEERARQQQKAQEQARHKAAPGNASARIPRVYQLTYQQYEDLWKLMKLSGKALGYGDIPWPPHDNPLFIEAGDSLASQKQKLRTALLRWHPDKFVSVCGNRLSPLERERIEARAKILAQEVIQLKNKMDSIS